MRKNINVAAIQMNARVGGVQGNLNKAERLVEEAFSKGAPVGHSAGVFLNGNGFSSFASRVIASSRRPGASDASPPGGKT